MKKETTLIKGRKFNTAMKKLVNCDFTWRDIDSTITSFTRADSLPESISATDVALENEIPFYIWLDGTDVKYYTEADTVYLNKDSSWMFSGLNCITSLDLHSFNTSKVTDMSYMFSECRSIRELDISDFKTNNVIDMSYMFSYCEYLTMLDLSSFNTSKVKNMNCMFYKCTRISYLNMQSFDNFYNIPVMSSVLIGCESLKTIVIKGTKSNNILWNYGVFDDLRYCDFKIVEEL